MILLSGLNTFGHYLRLMGRTFSRPERMRMFFKQYFKEMTTLGTGSIGIVLLISFFYWSRHLYSDKAQHSKCLDAYMGFGLCDT